jgi:hypothetical protein
MRLMILVTTALLAAPVLGAAQAPFYPAPEPNWEKRRPEQVGMDGAKLQEAIAFARSSESQAPRDLELAHYTTFGREPFGQAVGPFSVRGPQGGIIVRNG